MTPDEWRELIRRERIECEDFWSDGGVDFLRQVSNLYVPGCDPSDVIFYRKNEHGDFIRLERKPQKKKFIKFETGAEAVAWLASHQSIACVFAAHPLGRAELFIHETGFFELMITRESSRSGHLLAPREFHQCTDWHVEVEE